MADVFGTGSVTLKTPLTAEKATINWGGVMTSAINITISHQRPITIRRTIGNKTAAIYGGLPQGSIQIGRLLTTDASSLFSGPGWDICQPATLTVTFGGDCGGGAGVSFTCSGAIVEQMSLSADIDSNTVGDNINIRFIELSAG